MCNEHLETLEVELLEVGIRACQITDQLCNVLPCAYPKISSIPRVRISVATCACTYQVTGRV